MKNLNELSKRVHDNAVMHGWWNEQLSNEHYLMLIITEIAEMVEADRKGNDARIRHAEAQRRLPNKQKCKYTEELNRVFYNDCTRFIEAFEKHIKDTIQDEMADVFIRLLDLAASLGIDFDKFTKMHYHRAFGRFSFTDNAFALTKGLCRENINIFKRIQFGVEYVKNWAIELGVDFEWHVKMKMKYNTTRPFKHGKRY